jgi:RimJ/RimL family protein N-acetyltransferase
VIPALTTERLRLRAFEESDLDAWAPIVADPEVGRYTGGVQDRLEAWRSIALYLGHWELRGFGQWALEERSSGRLVGRAGLWFPEGWPELEVGWLLGRSVWGQGYATEAGRASISWARSTLGLRRIGSVINPDNARSIAVAERLGMTFDRTDAVGDQPVSVYAMSL